VYFTILTLGKLYVFVCQTVVQFDQACGSVVWANYHTKKQTGNPGVMSTSPSQVCGFLSQNAPQAVSSGNNSQLLEPAMVSTG